MRNSSYKYRTEFPWPLFITGIFLFVCSIVFKAYDLLPVSFLAIFGSLGLFLYDRRLKKK